MKVTIEYDALLRLLVACGEAKGVLLRATQLEGSSLYNMRKAAEATRASLEAALAEVVTAPATVEG